MSEYGYVRVSSTDQNEASKLDATRKRTLPERTGFRDKRSGRGFERPQD